MKNPILLLAAAGVIFFTACSGNSTDIDNKNSEDTTVSVVKVNTGEQKAAAISYTVAENYFVKNTYKGETLTNPVIETQSGFDSIFGMAATMKSKPTPIDFTKQYVIAVIGNTTDTSTIIQPVSLQKESDGNIAFTYEIIKKGGKQSFAIKPFLLIIVDNAYKGNIVLKKQE